MRVARAPASQDNRGHWVPMCPHLHREGLRLYSFETWPFSHHQTRMCYANRVSIRPPGTWGSQAKQAL